MYILLKKKRICKVFINLKENENQLLIAKNNNNNNKI